MSVTKSMLFDATLLNYCYCGTFWGISFKSFGFETGFSCARNLLELLVQDSRPCVTSIRKEQDCWHGPRCFHMFHDKIVRKRPFLYLRQCSGRRYYVFRLFVCLWVCASGTSLAQCLEKCWIYFHQTFSIGAFWDKELLESKGRSSMSQWGSTCWKMHLFGRVSTIS